MTDQREQDDRADPSDSTEPIDRADASEPSEPIDRADPTDPTESTDPLEAMLSTESSDHSDQRDLEGVFIPKGCHCVRRSRITRPVPAWHTGNDAPGGG